MIREIEAKTLLSSVRQPETWFGLKYNMNLYRGCQHRCIYCDSRSECYGIEDFDGEVLVKANALERLRDELPRKRVKGTIGTGSMNDPYMPLEAERNLLGQALEIIAGMRFPVHIITKSDLVLRDLPILERISEVYAAVTFTLTTADDDLARKVEPGAPAPSARLRAMRALADHGILTGVTMMPILPFIEDTEENISDILGKAHAAGAQYVIPAMGMTLRDRQQEYYYQQLDRLFPGVRQRYERQFGNAYSCSPHNAKRLYQVIGELCERYGIAGRMPVYSPAGGGEQLPLF